MLGGSGRANVASARKFALPIGVPLSAISMWEANNGRLQQKKIEMVSRMPALAGVSSDITANRVQVPAVRFEICRPTSSLSYDGVVRAPAAPCREL